MATNLEASIERLCAERGLSAVSFSYNYTDPRIYSCFVHRGGQCAGEHGVSLAEAIGKAIAALDATDVALADEALPELAA